MSSYLEDPELDWTRPEVAELRDVLVLAFRKPEAAEQLADRSGLAPGTFPMYTNMRATWTELVREAANQGMLEKLVENAASDPTAGGYRPRFEDLLKAAPEVAPPQPPIDAPPQPPIDAGQRGIAEPPELEISPQRLLERRSRLMRIELAAAVTAAARSVVRLALRFGAERAHGTGFLIGPSHVLTNHHNIHHEKFGAVTGIVVEFDYEERFKDEPLVRQGKLDTIVGDRTHDWAVVELTSPVDRPVVALGTPYDIGPDDAVVIIQHPLGAFKKFSLEPLAVQSIDEDRIRYIADTQQGSSGSPVFNAQMHVIGLHHAEAEVEVPVDGGTTVVWQNQGITITRVMKGLESKGIPFARNE